MDDLSSDPEQEVRQLRRCMLDLVSVLALPAVWSSEPGRILETLLDALLAMLDLDFLYGTINLELGTEPAEVLRVAPSSPIVSRPGEILQTLKQWFGHGIHRWSPQRRRRLGDLEISIFPLPLGIGGDFGFLVAGSRRAGFPEDTERLTLCVAANQTAIGLQHTLRLHEQKRVAGELDRQVAERTRTLAASNEALQLQVNLLQNLPVSAWTLKPDGTPDFVNQVWLEFSGQTLEYVRSHPEAWMTAVHPDDREKASSAFWEGVRSGKNFAFATRSLRAGDGTYRWLLQQAVVVRDAEGQLLKFIGTTTDIDDQKRAEEALRASEANLRRVIDTIPSLSWCNLPDGPNEFLSQSWHEYTGLSAEEAHGWGWTASFHPQDLPPLMKRWQEILISGESGEIEARIRRHDGVYRWFLIRASPFRDETGAIIRWYGTSTDIEDRKRAEDELRRSEARHRVVVQTASDAVISISEGGVIILANPATKQIFGYDPEELIGQPLTLLMPEGARKLHEAGYKRYLETGERRLNWQGTELTARRANGEEFPVGVSFGEVTAEGQRIFTGFIRDISEWKRAEQALLASEQHFRLIVDGIAGLVAILSPTGSVEVVNRQFLAYFGRTAGDLKEWSTSNAVHPEDLPAVFAAWQRSTDTASDYDVDHRLLRADGEYRWFHARGLPLRDAAGRVLRWYVLLTDIHDRRQAEEALTRAREELARVTRATSLGVLTASIAHEVNQPLSGIVTNAGTCLRMLNSEPPNIDGARETARRMIRDANRASDVITRLRALFRKKDAAADWVDLSDAAREVIVLSLGELQTNRIVLIDELADDLPPVRGDRVQIQQVILNLLRNASDAMRGVAERPRHLHIRTELDADGHVRLTVRDSGVGFDSAIADRLFESFYTTKDDGMGIGLSVSRSIIEAHEGRLWAARNDGPGATFAFSLPRVRGEPAAAGPL